MAALRGWNLVTDEYKLQKGVRGPIFLKAEFESMQAALPKVSEAPIDQPPDNQVKLWAREVRQLSYDVEDKIDIFMVRIDRGPKDLHGLRGFIDRSMDLLTKAKIRHKLGTQIKDLRSSIKEVSERCDRYMVTQVAAMPADVPVQNLRLSDMYKKAVELIGTEEKSNELIQRLIEREEPYKKQLTKVSIVGFGGLGKTTLAKVVYDKLKEQFDCTGFVSVSLNPNLERIFISLLCQLGHRRSVVTSDTEQLINEARDFLQDKRTTFSIHNIEKFLENVNIYIIISTTRNLDVANKIGGVYQLQPLSLADSRKLFNLRIFGTEDKCLSNKLAEVSAEILQKCGGVPLAIITIASTLASKEGMENKHQYWSKVCKTLGSGLEDGPDVEDMRRILAISYYDLPMLAFYQPTHLKNCMLYLSSYPEDYLISTKELIWKWMGEGFILKEQGRSFDEVGVDYINELINRSMIQGTDIDEDSNKVDLCRVHDMVLDLITRLANKDGILATIHDQQPKCQQDRMHRLCLQTSNEEDVKDLSSANLCHVRSLIADVCPEAFNHLPPLSTFPVLRVLCLNGCEQVDNRCFREICNLIHLRYLGLGNTSITDIPKEIQKLQLLQVLDISDTGIHKLPSTFVLLRKLVCLRADTLERLPAGFGNLKLLQQLDVFAIYVGSPSMLINFSGLTELRHVTFMLHEWDEGYVKPFIQCLSSLVNLESLYIIGSELPKWISALSALTILHIRLLVLGEEGLHVLGSIPSLSHLFIRLDRGEELVISNAYPFPSLRKFKILLITRVVFAQGAMPKLQTLELGFGRIESSMGQSGDFAVGFENLPSLEDVNVCLYYLVTRPKELKVAKATIQNAVDMNKNKPLLETTPKETSILSNNTIFV
ncbi:hypothetical protein PVAP13_8NG138603 [Panicum virgatum]|uniref:Uncharacterized protein n=1 Tax=Panicum virgatum TaxID=38727 RepID=A0A8T0PIG7_PANVG|nr:hypothetical protein PVAP13_8NG138603 [Panicum virgatum]